MEPKDFDKIVRFAMGASDDEWNAFIARRNAAKMAQQEAKVDLQTATNGESTPCVHKWEYGMFHNICAKCGLVDDA